jgi:hypothetical protein
MKIQYLACVSLVGVLTGALGCGGDENDVGLGCEGKMLKLEYAQEALNITCFRTKFEMRQDAVLGFYGTSTEKMRFVMGPIGNNAAFDKAQKYDAADHEYHMELLAWPEASGGDCAATTDCRRFYGLAGTWNVSSVKPVDISFEFTTVVDKQNCWTVASDGTIDTSNCTVLGGTLKGCVVD